MLAWLLLVASSISLAAPQDCSFLLGGRPESITSSMVELQSALARDRPPPSAELLPVLDWSIAAVEDHLRYVDSPEFVSNLELEIQKFNSYKDLGFGTLLGSDYLPAPEIRRLTRSNGERLLKSLQTTRSSLGSSPYQSYLDLTELTAAFLTQGMWGSESTLLVSTRGQENFGVDTTYGAQGQSSSPSQILTEFPGVLLLPTFGSLTVWQMNEWFAYDIYPLALARGWNDFDGIRGLPYLLFNHDLRAHSLSSLHANPYPRRGNALPKETAERITLFRSFRLWTAGMPERTRSLLELAWFEITHEFMSVYKARRLLELVQQSFLVTPVPRGWVDKIDDLVDRTNDPRYYGGFVPGLPVTPQEARETYELLASFLESVARPI